MNILTATQKRFIEGLPAGCRFYQEESIRGLSRTIRVQVPGEFRTAHLLHVEYAKDPDGVVFRSKLQAAKTLYDSTAKSEPEEFDIPF
jgi:hypothetical protein